MKAVEAAPTGRQLYVWMKDGRSGVVDMSDWTGHPCDKWDTEGFNRWKVDAGMASGEKTATSHPFSAPRSL